MKNHLLNKLVVLTKLEDTTLVKGAKNLLNDATTVLLGFTVAVVVILVAIQVFCYLKAGDDDGEKKARKKAAIGILVGGVVLLCIEGIVATIFGYFV